MTPSLRPCGCAMAVRNGIMMWRLQHTKEFSHLLSSSGSECGRDTTSPAVAALAVDAVRPSATVRTGARPPSARPTPSPAPPIATLVHACCADCAHAADPVLYTLTIPRACRTNAYHTSTPSHAHRRSQPALSTRRLLWSCSRTRSRERVRAGDVVLLKVADSRCRLQEAEAYAWPRRMRAGAVRGGRDGSVVLWHCGTLCRACSWSACPACA